MLSFLSGIILIFLTCALCFLYKKKIGKYDLVFWFILFFGFVYGGAQCLVGLFYKKAYALGVISGEFSENYSDENALFVALLSSGFIFSFFCYSWFLCRLKFFSGTSKFRSLHNFNMLSNINVVSNLGVFFFVTSFISYYIYTLPYGGFIGYIEYSAILRSGLMDSLPANRFSFLIAFGGFSIIASLLFYSIFDVKFKYKVLFFLAFLFAFFILFSKLGRISILFYFATFFIFHSFKERDILKVNFLYLTFIFFIAIFLLLIINVTLGRGEGFDSAALLLTKEFIFVFSNIGLVVSNGVDYRLGVDYVFSPFYVLPSSWYSSFITNIDSYNTLNYYGVMKGEGGNTSSIPVDVISFSVYQFGFFGVFISSFFLALLIKFCDFIVCSIPQKNLRLIFFSYSTLFISFLSVLYSDPAHFVSRLFPFISFFLLIFFMNILGLFRKLKTSKKT